MGTTLPDHHLDQLLAGQAHRAVGNRYAATREAEAAAAVEPSPTELKVLRYLPTNLSRPEIAGELSVSVNTVNTHIRNVYAKLQAGDRSSPVQHACALRLLAAGRNPAAPFTGSW